MKKRANESILGALRHGFVNSLKSPATLGLMAAPFAAMGMRKYEKHRDARDALLAKTTAYREMLDLHPHFKQRDQADIGRIYNSLHNASPHMARDPLVAGAWVDNILENRHPGMNSHQALLNAVKDLNGIQKNVVDIERNQFGQSRAEGVGNWIKDYTQQLDRNVHNSLDQHVANENAQLEKKREEIEGRRSSLLELANKVQMKAEREDLDEQWKALQRAKGKHASAHTPLGDMLRALKV